MQRVHLRKSSLSLTRHWSYLDHSCRNVSKCDNHILYLHLQITFGRIYIFWHNLWEYVSCTCAYKNFCLTQFGENYLDVTWNLLWCVQIFTFCGTNVSKCETNAFHLLNFLCVFFLHNESYRGCFFTIANILLSDFLLASLSF